MATHQMNTQGSEIHRLKEISNYDRKEFEKLYKAYTPLVKRLSKNIDHRRYDVTPDVIQSYFWDKFLYVYNKYKGEGYDYNRLRATLISALKTFKNKLLRNAYTKQAEFNQDLTSFEDIYEKGEKEWEDESDETEYKEDLSQRFNEYMKDHLTEDEFILFRTELDPPPFFEERMKESHGKISILSLIDYFELPRDRKSAQYMSAMRNHIKEVLETAKSDFKR